MTNDLKVEKFGEKVSRERKKLRVADDNDRLRQGKNV